MVGKIWELIDWQKAQGRNFFLETWYFWRRQRNNEKMSLNRGKRSSFSWVNPRILLSWKQEATIKTKRVDVEVWEEERGVTKRMMTSQHINKFYWYKWKVTTVHSVEHINSFVFRISWRISKTEAMLNLPSNLIFLWSLLLRKKCLRMKW